MPDRQQVRASSRNISGSNPADKPGHKTQFSTVTVEGCEHLTHPEELRSMAQHHIEAQGDPSIVDHVDDDGSTLVYPVALFGPTSSRLYVFPEERFSWTSVISAL